MTVLSVLDAAGRRRSAGANLALLPARLAITTDIYLRGHGSGSRGFGAIEQYRDTRSNWQNGGDGHGGRRRASDRRQRLLVPAMDGLDAQRRSR
jgi:hypothetical protein